MVPVYISIYLLSPHSPSPCMSTPPPLQTDRYTHTHTHLDYPVRAENFRSGPYYQALHQLVTGRHLCHDISTRLHRITPACVSRQYRCKKNGERQNPPGVLCSVLPKSGRVLRNTAQIKVNKQLNSESEARVWVLAAWEHCPKGVYQHFVTAFRRHRDGFHGCFVSPR